MPPQPQGHPFRQQLGPRLDLLRSRQIPAEGEAVSHGLGRRGLSRRADKAVVPAVGRVVELLPVFAQPFLQVLPAGAGQVPNGMDVVLRQHPGGGPPHKEQVRHRQGPENLGHLFPGNDRGGVGLFVVAAQLGKHLIKRDPHGNGQPQFPLHLLPQPVRQGRRVPAEESQGPRHIQPALVDAEGLHQVCIPAVDLPGQAGVIPVLVMVGGQKQQGRALPPGLPNGLRRLYPLGLGRLVLGQDDPVAGRRVPADRHGLLPQLRVAQQLHRGIECVQITVKNHPVHSPPSSLPVKRRKAAGLPRRFSFS